MKFKTLSLIAGAIALTLTATPFTVQAQTNFSAPIQIAQGKGGWNKLGLTDAQKAQMQEIRRNTKAQIEQVLTSEQKAKLKAMMQERKAQRQNGGEGQRQGRKRGDVFAALNLTETQKSQMRQIRESAKQQRDAVLTPAQKQQMEQLKQEARSRRQQGNLQ
ncbi:P pilus assembly/Cpx signaling pathway, periplasmic inhibitor/zinc-resistance associated protein [Cronbergia sp. UHCC 0137]|uniref:Spy/CpxP family protein refolding chaperone n=1 Tax=Cronbergia sp. UHCC 0137 TaxID=3110239 RepID=UPI002B20CC67|nr:P pilus assembly/Cpx signaling pathway, periplasmic inhibitor/zinc-resistance associated protein [Cronbergia sp. UHCC 0137]MEA5616304.1 P pilus assembly/Cpx signaling pathway, periplasmic inhibitor/zinc-resistance associated protein [Cronbergia sp. UHCC 0137]